MDCTDHERSRRSRARTRAEARCRSALSQFQADPRRDGVAWLLFDREGTSANTLSADLIEELDKVLAELEGQRPTGLVIRSAKKSGFIAGADVNEFRGATDPRRGRDRDRPRACGDRPARSLEDSDRRRDPRLLPRRRPRSRARLPDADRDRGRALRFSRGDARPASRPRRHRALHAAGQSDAGDDADADRQDHRCAEGKVARAGRRRDAGAACPQCGKGRRVRPPEARAAGDVQHRLRPRSRQGLCSPRACAARPPRPRRKSIIPRPTR